MKIGSYINNKYINGQNPLRNWMDVEKYCAG